MTKVYLTKGLPGSGKSTWAKEMVAENPGNCKRINKDDLRAMLDGGVYSKTNEKFILQIRTGLILLALEQGKDVIVDDTNLVSKHEEDIRVLIQGKAELIVQDFTHIPLEVCIQRDLKRLNSVGEAVIRKMYEDHLYKPEVYVEDQHLPKAIIVDVDGTLAHMQGRGPFEWARVREDRCNQTIKNVVNSYQGNVIIFSGRDGCCKDDTIAWLKDNNIRFNEIYMRAEKNIEKDSVIKRRLFDDCIRGRYNIEYVLDDRNQVVEMWRGMGLTCLQVAEGNF